MRFAWVGGAWTLLWLGSPGVVFENGSAPLAVAAIVLWSLGAMGPGKKPFLVEWLAAALGLSAICWWSTQVVWIALLGVALVPALYVALAGVLLRRLARGVPLALAAPSCWIALETLRGWVEPPLGFGWLRLGHYASDVPWLAGSARVWGVVGLSFVLAGVAGALADWIRARFGMTDASGQPTAAGQGTRAWIARGLATGPLALAPLLCLATAPPPTEPGPQVLLVQPAFEQHRKMERFDTWPDLVDLTKKGLQGAGRVDLVCWGETLWPSYLDGGAPWGTAKPPPWWNLGYSQAELQRDEGKGIRILRNSVLPPGCSFLAGAEVVTPYRGEIRRVNGAVLWGPDGKRIGWGAKLHLVPGGETMAGLERWAWVRNAAHELANYVPDLVAGDETSVVDLPVKDFRSVRLGLSVCFDNTYDDPYTGPLRRGPLDAHVILSNEAWYGESCEYDHMLAFSRLAAIATGRALARVTNSGVSALFGPDGKELARLRVGGKDRMVGGSLLVTLPVPKLGHAGDRTPFVRAEPYLRWLAVLCPFLLLALWRPRARLPLPEERVRAP